MGQKTKSRVECRDFPGLMSGPDPADIPPGAAQDQLNLMSVHEGQLESRPAVEAVVFEEE